MFKKLACKFFPDCYDDDECLYEHRTGVNEESGCPNGKNCSDQECLFSENEHKTLNKIVCRFQARCNRSGCQFQHNITRQAFLGVRLSERGKV